MNERAARVQHLFDLPTLIAAGLTLPCVLLQNNSPHGSTLQLIGLIGNLASWLVFVAEVVVMLCVAPSKKEWIRSHPLDIIIALLSEPFLFPLLQLLRLLRLPRSMPVGELLKNVLTPDGLRYIAFAALVLLVASAEAFHLTEHVDYGNAIYWTITTVTTVGFGDIAPSDTASKIVACVVMLVGSVFFAVITGAVAQQFVYARNDEHRKTEARLLAEIQQIGEQLQRLETRADPDAKATPPAADS